MWAKEPEGRDQLGATVAVELKDRCFELEQRALVVKRGCLMAMVVKRGRRMTDCVCRLKEKGENNEVLVVPLIMA